MWRTGRKLAVTIYRDEHFIGVAQTPEGAVEIVDGMNKLAEVTANYRELDRRHRLLVESRTKEAVERLELP